MPTYRHRLRLEGGVLALSGAISSALLIATTPSATSNSGSTTWQLAAVGLLMATAGVWSVLRSLARAAEGAEGGGQPTALWLLPLVVAALTLAFGLPAGAWDAGLRVGLGCVIVGLFQAVVFEQIVAARERREGVRYFRMPGSSVFKGTKLGRAPC